MKYSKERIENSMKRLSDLLKPGDTVHAVLRHVSRSGMSRDIDFYVIRDSEPIYITCSVATVCGYPMSKDSGLKVGGCGMDMGFAVVYDLSHTLYPHGFTCAGKRKRCPSNDHTNGDKSYRRHKHKDGGYALRHRWM